MAKTRRKQKQNQVTLIERAKTGRATCRYCGELIANNSVRYGVEAVYRSQTGHSNLYHRYYHPYCVQQVGIRVAKHLKNHKLLVKTPRFSKDDYKYFVPSWWLHAKNEVPGVTGPVSFKLEIEEPYPDSEVPFKLTLHQLDHQRKPLTPALTYPPKNKNKPVMDRLGCEDAYIEYDSIHKLMLASYLKTKRTPADIFGLIPLLSERKKRWEEDQAFKRAANRAAEQYRNSNNCTCETRKLMVWGCVCGVFEAELKQATRQESLVKPSLVNISTPKNGFLNTSGSHVHQLNAIPEKLNAAPEKEENSLVTAKEVLDKVVSTRYADLAEQVADARAQVDIDREALVPGMKVYHKITDHRYILLQREGSNWLARRLADNEDATLEPAVISCKPASLVEEQRNAAVWLAALGIITVIIPLTIIIVGLALR